MKKSKCITHRDGTKEWWFNGELHREDGPAIECRNGTTKIWYLNNKRHTREEYYNELYKRKIITLEEAFAELL